MTDEDWQLALIEVIAIRESTDAMLRDLREIKECLTRIEVIVLDTLQMMEEFNERGHPWLNLP